jgi:1-deoxy-D-xylulose-5-phosphate reductoisomerase
MKKIVVCGSTGSIGRQTLDVCEWFPDKLQVVGLVGGSNIELLAEQVKKFKPEVAALANADKYAEFKRLLGDSKTEILVGENGVLQVAGMKSADMQVAAISGLAGLQPTLKGLDAGLDIAFANKEVLVAAGELVMKWVSESGCRFLPVDSEHSAIWQCLEGKPGVESLLLTCSGGPFKNASADEIVNAGVEETLRHPTWQMGAKITVDSATLLNKGLEIIEAHWLFDVPYERISAVIHPESIIHSMVQFEDGSLLAQCSYPDMRLPIQYALSHPQRWQNELRPLNFAEIGRLTFREPDEMRFPCLRLAKQAGKAGGTLTAVLSGANEALVYAFLQGRIKLGRISEGLEAALAAHENIAQPNLEEIIQADAWARRFAADWLAKNC